MFSGIIERLGSVAALDRRERDVRLSLRTGFPDLTLGESVAVNGVCLTVTRFDAGGAAGDPDAGTADFFVSPETLSVTALGRLEQGARVNLERAVTPRTRLSGHIVQGHVDGIGHLRAVSPSGDARELGFALPARLRRYCVPKGSICLDGISLTLNRLGDPDPGDPGPGDPDGGGTFEAAVTIIPHTWDHTTLGRLRFGEPVNVEVDVIAKYVEQLSRTAP